MTNFLVKKHVLTRLIVWKHRFDILQKNRPKIELKSDKGREKMLLKAGNGIFFVVYPSYFVISGFIKIKNFLALRPRVLLKFWAFEVWFLINCFLSKNECKHFSTWAAFVAGGEPNFWFLINFFY